MSEIIDWYGWTGTLLIVDLTLQQVIKEPLPKQIAMNFLGGDGLGTKLLFDRVQAELPPLDPKQLYILATGPLTGTLCPSSGRLATIFKSPLTGLIATSNAGGFMAPEIKWAGYDAIIISGKAKNPVWLWVDNDRVEIRDASHLWGKDTFETCDAIKKEVEDETIHIMSIGPAGEKLVAYALPLLDRGDAPGKCGAGAVMGFKKLKAIGVRGTQGVRIFDPDQFQKLCWNLHERIRSSEPLKGRRKYGTARAYAIFDEIQGALPVYNFQEGAFPQGRKGLSIDRLVEIQDRDYISCFGCPIQCRRFFNFKTGKYKGVKTEGVEFYAQFAFGPNIGVDNWEFAIKAHEVCNRLGLQFSVGAVMSWAAELYQRGILTREDLDGIDLKWGNEEAFLELLQKIAHREGIGNILGGSFDEMTAQIGKDSEKYLTLINRLDTSECPRARKQMALSHLISNRGGDHNLAMADCFVLAPPPDEIIKKFFPKGLPKGATDEYNPVGKSQLVNWAETFHSMCNSLVVCHFSTAISSDPKLGGHPEDYAAMVTAATGVKYDRERILGAAERTAVLQRSFNVREGWERDQLYQMSDKWYETAVSNDGQQKGTKADRKLIRQLVDEFLAFKGFDPVTGYPTREKLGSLGLTGEAKEMEKLGRLSEKSIEELHKAYCTGKKSLTRLEQCTSE